MYGINVGQRSKSYDCNCKLSDIQYGYCYIIDMIIVKQLIKRLINIVIVIK